MLTFRAATESDIPALRSLAGTIWRTCYPDIISGDQIEYMLDLMYSPAVIQREMAEGVMWELLLEEEESIGYIAGRPDRDQERLDLHKLYLLPAFHGRGVGRQALESLQTRALDLGMKEIRLTVNKRNVKAIRAYERAGFQIVDAVVNDIGGGYVMDDYVMTLSWNVTSG